MDDRQQHSVRLHIDTVDRGRATAGLPLRRAGEITPQGQVGRRCCRGEVEAVKDAGGGGQTASMETFAAAVVNLDATPACCRGRLVPVISVPMRIVLEDQVPVVPAP